LQDGSTLAVRQFHFTTWPDHGVPLYPTSLLAFHKKFRCCYDSPSGPTVIHCSAGVGRTGTFIALDYLLDQAQAENAVDVYGCVCQMRKSRVSMVQTVVSICLVQLIAESYLNMYDIFSLYRMPLCRLLLYLLLFACMRGLLFQLCYYCTEFDVP